MFYGLAEKLNIFMLSFTYNIFFDGEGRAESTAKEKEREEKVRKIREQQEDERKKKLEELKQHVSVIFLPSLVFMWFLFQRLYMHKNFESSKRMSEEGILTS